MSDKVKRFLIVLGCSLAPIICFVLGLFSGISLSKSKSISSAYADELKVTTFESGSIIINPLMTSKWVDGNVTHNVNYLSVESFDTRFTFTLDNNDFYLRYYVIFADGTTADFFNTSTTSLIPSDSWNSNFSKRVAVTGNDMLVIDRTFFGKSSQDFGAGAPVTVDSYSSGKLSYAEFYYNENLDMADIYKVEYYTGKTNENNLNTNFLYINFLDIDNNYMFRFAVNCGLVSDKLIRYMNSTSNGTYEQGYQDGYNADKNFIHADINQRIEDAYDNGYADGQTSRDSDVERAYTNGFIQGKEFSGDNITLTELFTGVAEVPFGTVKSMLNFDLLGINLASLVTGLLTGLLVIKLIMLLV